ncbi:YncE family protein [Paracidobacterium acidisoli]|nr:YncE family protein [Paracidobacterium acidisoli]MBT9333097.1 YncE family protein [Paracidobacterium acidisoli]
MRLSAMKNLLAVAAMAVAVSLPATAQTVSSQISFTEPVQGITENPLTNQIYAVVTLGAGTSDALVVINGKSDTVTATIPIPNGSYVPAVDILTNRVFVTNCTFSPLSCGVTVVDGFKNKVITTIPVTTTTGDGLLGITADPLRGKIYVSNGSDHVVDVINAYTNTLTGKITIAGEPWGLAINPDNNRLYVTLGGSEVAIVDPATQATLQTVTVGEDDYNVAVNWVSGNVFVPNTLFGFSTTAVLDKKGNVLSQVQVGEAPEGVDVDPITNLAFVANSSDNTVTVIDGKSNTATATVGGIPAFFLVANPATQKVYISGGETVTVMTEK